MAKEDFQYSEEVAHALANNLPIVALESTIISHGMPYPENVNTARAVEDIIRTLNVVPATIAILHGKVHIGLDDTSLETLGKAGRSCLKCSRRDLPLALAQKVHGATTVAATMYLAARAGLRIFVTGGIGGVHRGVEDTWDVSADLIELGRTPITVVCAGAKSILDIPKTLEFLETQGVPVVVYNSKYFPAFFSPSSGIEVGHVVHSPADCAKLIAYNHKLGLDNGILVAVPLQQADQNSQIENIIEQAVEEAKQQNVKGAAITPFLLARINDLSGGSSLDTNIQLIKQNAEFGARIAKAYYTRHRVTCLGATIQLIQSGENRIGGGLGGVAHIAAELASPLISVDLVSAIGQDYFGKSMMNELKASGVSLTHSVFLKGSSDAYHMMGEGNVRLYLKQITNLSPESIPFFVDRAKFSNVVILDTFLSEEMWNFISRIDSELNLALHVPEYGDLQAIHRLNLLRRIRILTAAAGFVRSITDKSADDEAASQILQDYPNLKVVIVYAQNKEVTCVTAEGLVKGVGKETFEETVAHVLQNYILMTKLESWVY